MTTTIIYSPEDTYIDEDDKTDNHGANDTIHVGKYETDSIDYNLRGLMKFDLSSLSPDITINNAKVSLFCYAQQSPIDRYVTFYRSLVQWFEGVEDRGTPAPGEDGSTYRWRNHNGSVIWVGGVGTGGVSGDDWDATMTAQKLITTVGAWYEWDVAADIQDFVDGVHTNHGWFMLGEEDKDDSEKNFRSEQASSSELRPFLTIDSTPAVTVPPTLTGCCVPKDERGP